MNFSEALSFLKKGHKLYRSGWNGKKLYVYLHVTQSILSDEQLDSDVEADPIFYICDENKKTVNAWLASQADLLADDWDLIKAEIE